MKNQEIQSLIKNIQITTATRMPNPLWRQLYQQLSSYLASLSHFQQSALLVTYAPLEMQIVNLNHQSVLTIPQPITSWSHVKTYPSFNFLPIPVQNQLQKIISDVSNTANHQRQSTWIKGRLTFQTASNGHFFTVFPARAGLNSNFI